MYKAVIFDLDGTLIDSMQIWRQVDQEFLGKRGIPVPEDLFAHLPQGNSYIQTAQYFKDRFHLPDSVENIMQEWTDAVYWHYQNDIPLKEGAKTVIEWLAKHHILLGIGTSNSYKLAIATLQRNNILSFFQTIVTGCQALRGKPFPDIYLKAASELCVPAEYCIVIEDTLSGIRAAKTAGMQVIAIYDKDSESEKELIIKESDYYVFDYSQVLIRLKEILNLD